MTNEQKIVIEDIHEMLDANIDSIINITIRFLVAYSKSIFTFGKGSKITKECLQSYKEYLCIAKEEKLLFKTILKNIDYVDIEKLDVYISNLDEINDQTLLYYIDVFDNVETTCELQFDQRIIRPPTRFESITSTNTYRIQLLNLVRCDKKKSQIKRVLFK